MTALGDSQAPTRPVTITIGGQTIAPGRRRAFEIPMARLPTDTWLSLPVVVINGRRAGPRLFLSGAIHGDELNGVEIVRRVTAELDPRSLAGLVIAVPIVNVFGFINESRYLPDRRDLNRSFPGSPRGPLAARMAHLFMQEVVARCDYGLDLHTGSWSRTNLPQVRGDLLVPEVRRCAEAFGAPIMLHSRVRDGSLRQAAGARGVHVLLYEGGEAHRFDAFAIDRGVEGVLRVMRELGMWDGDGAQAQRTPLATARSNWIRARRGGILRLDVGLGQTVTSGQLLGSVADAFGTGISRVRSRADGIVIGFLRKPLVNQGDAIVHIAEQVGPPDDAFLEATGVRDDLLA
ncbi:MAG TPA: succinylglutamate desuccinylase/aspartoacylase family protein [Acidimicrobiia bacterium]|nr:succinylglutamate desuccinylase/aspartoacylase family protein [Acidimicrobiia bacterium]